MLHRHPAAGKSGKARTTGGRRDMSSERLVAVESRTMFRAYLLSFLARQRLLLEQKFDGRYPHHWLVWEPGSWKAPPVNAAVAETRLPSQARPLARAQAGDALCFELS